MVKNNIYLVYLKKIKNNEKSVEKIQIIKFPVKIYQFQDCFSRANCNIFLNPYINISLTIVCPAILVIIYIA